MGSNFQELTDRLSILSRALRDALMPTQEQIDSVEGAVEVLFGELDGVGPDFDDIPDNLPFEERIALIEERVADHPTHIENLIAALDVLFEQRFGWEPGSVGRLTFAQVQIALDHALEFDSPKRPSVWEITR